MPPALQAVDYDPFAAKKAAPPPSPSRGSKLTPVDHNPFATFEPDSTFRADLGTRVPGARDTGDYRTPEREAALRRQGALTAPSGGGPHSLGQPGEPGAHDFVDPNLTLAQARARFANDPAVKDVIWEPVSGGQPAHFHVNMRQTFEPVDYDPFAAPTPKAAAPAPAKPAAPTSAFADQVARPSQGYFQQIGSDVAGEVKEAGGQLAKDVKDPNRNFFTQDKIAMDVLNLPYSAVAGGIEGAVGEPMYGIQSKTPDERKKRLLGQVGALAAPADLGASGLINRLRKVPEAVEFERDVGQGLGHDPAPGPTKLTQPPPHPYTGAFGPAGRRPKPVTDRALPPFTPKGVPQPVQAGKKGQPRLVPVDHDPFAERPKPLAASIADKEPRTDVVGDEPHAPTRTANALYRLNGSNIADKIELGGARKALKKAHGDKSEALYHALEEPLAGGDAKLSPELAEAKAALQPYLKEQTDIINRLRERNDPTLDKFTEDQGYVHRIRSDQPDLLDSSDQGGPRSPFQTRKSLVKTASSQKERKYIALEDPKTGERTFPKGQGEKGDPYGELKPGMTFRPAGEAPKGQPEKAFKVVQPTTKEIEANTPTRYKKDAIDNTIANVFQLRRVERNLDVLEQTLADMKERGVAHREEWTYKDPETGKPTVGRSNAQTPQGFRSLPDVPQLKGWKFDHGDAQVQELKDWLPKHDEDWVTRLDRVNNFMLRSNFLSPFVHPKNIAEFWGASRGWDWLHPEGYGRLARTLPEAWREVMTMGPKYQQYLREGSALLSADSRTQDFNAMLTDKAGDELINDPKSFDGLKKAFGDIVGTPAQLYAKFQEASHKMMWSLGDTMMMQRVLELQDKGMPIRDAIAKAEEMIPNYRVPAQIMNGKTGGRMLHHLFANNRFFSVGRYHYAKLAAWGRMFRKIAKGSPEEKKEALGQFLAMAVMGAAVVPAVDKGLQIATGNQNARVKRGGVLALPDAAVRTAEGKEGVAQAIAQVVDLSPEARTLVEGVTNKDYFGNDRFSKYRSLSGNAAGAAELPLSQFGPAQGTLEALSPGYGPERTIGNMFGVDLPSKPPGQVKGSTAKMLRGRYKHQDHNDPLARMLGAR